MASACDDLEDRGGSGNFNIHTQRVTMENEIWRLMELMQGQIAAEIRVMLGEASIASSNFTEEDRQRRIKAMKECAARSTSDQERHDSWMKMHIDSGWVYGTEFNSEKKTHPNLMPWDDLPATVKSKARIFDIVSKFARSLESLASVGSAG